MTTYVQVRRATLTAKEVDVLERVARGMTNAAIGRELYLSEESVKRRLRDIREVLGAADRAQAVNEGWRLGYLPRLDGTGLYRIACDGTCEYGVHACPSKTH